MGNPGIWIDLALISASFFVMTAICALEGWSR